MITRLIENGDAVAYFSAALHFNPKDISNEIKRKVEEKKHSFRKGDRYVLQSSECEGFEILKKEYEIVAVVEELNGIAMDSIIVKQVSGNKGTIFSLTKNDCKLLNIDFEQGLMIMPMAMNWIPSKIVKEKVEKLKEVERQFTSRNLATYPVDYETKTIKHMMVRLYGFNEEYAGALRTPYSLQSTKAVLESMKIKAKRPLECSNRRINCYSMIPFRLATPIIARKDRAITMDNSMFIELDFTFGDERNGIIPNELENLDFSDAFDVYWKEI